MEDKEFQELLTSLDYKVRSYSGRFMYGRTCLAVELTRDDSVFELIANVLREAVQDGADAVEYVAMAVESIAEDSMGLGTVVYFKKINFVPLNNEDEENEEDEEYDDHGNRIE